MMLDLAYLDDFLALARTGNFSRAAIQRAVTQPAFSRRIQALEVWAGAPLFARDAQPIVLTEAGRALHPVVADVVRDLRQGRERVRALASRGRSTLRFAATHVLSFTFFPAWLRGLDDQPLDAVELVSDSLEACEQLMLRGDGHFLLCHAHANVPVRLAARDFPWRRLGGDVLCPVSVPDASGRPRHDLTAAAMPIPHLAYSAASGLGRIVAAALPVASTRLDTVFTSHLAAALRTMALTGRGLAWLPLSLIADDLANGRLVRAGAPELDVAMDIRLVRASFDLGAAAEAFWDRLDQAR